MRNLARIGGAALLLTLPLAAGAGDSPQWRGPDRDGVFPEKGLLKDWPKAGPTLLWTFKDAGIGFSSPAVVGGRVYTMGARKGVEYVIALDEKGAESWKAEVGPVYDFKGNQWSGGPNGTPTVDGGLLYALGSQGVLVCVDAAGGAVKWKKDLPKELGARVNPVAADPDGNGWGFAWSPLVDGDRLIITPGGTGGLFAALDKKSGAVVWRSKDLATEATYSSPVAATVAGVRMYVALTQHGVAGVGADGGVLWEHKRANDFPDVVCPTPIVKDDLVYVTAWGGGSELLRLMPKGGKFEAETVYANKELGNRQGGVVLVGDHVYGFNETRAWVCQDFKTGAVKWTTPARGIGAGSVAYADGRLYVQGEAPPGVVALVEASPAKKFVPHGRFQLPEESRLRKPSGKVWTHPVIADGRLYLRDQELVFCYKIK